MASVLIKKNKPLKKTNKELVEKTTEEKVVKPYSRGLIYVGHIPHGFYEQEMRDYFKQFGIVTRVRLARSKKTGRSKGCGYVEFLDPAVAQVAATTMNNYHMCGRNLKARFIPSENVHKGFFSGKAWSETFYPKLNNRMRALKQLEAPQTEEMHKKNMKRKMSKLSHIEAKLKKAGVNISLQSVVHKPE